MIWTVFWALSALTACPQPEPDIYGRESYVVLAVACYEKAVHRKDFSDKERAEAFMEKGIKECSECFDWRIEETR